MTKVADVSKEVREALGLLGTVFVVTFLPQRLREWFTLSGPLAVALSMWLASILLVVIPVRPDRKKNTIFLIVATIICALMYLSGRVLNFPK